MFNLKETITKERIVELIYLLPKFNVIAAPMANKMKKVNLSGWTIKCYYNIFLTTL